MTQTAALVASYALAAILAFAIAIRCNRSLIATAFDDDPIGASFCVFSLFVLSAGWPITFLMFAVVGIFYLAIKLVLKVTQ